MSKNNKKNFFFYLLLLLSRVYHSSDPIRVNHKPERPIKPENSGLRIQSNVTDSSHYKIIHQPFHYGLSEPDSLKRRVNDYIPNYGVEYAVAGGSGEGYGLLALLVLHPEEGIGVFQGQFDFFGVASRESDGNEDGIEVVEVEAGGGAAEEEAAGF